MGKDRRLTKDEWEELDPRTATRKSVNKRKKIQERARSRQQDENLVFDVSVNEKRH